jgi:hypothetical protein
MSHDKEFIKILKGLDTELLINNLEITHELLSELEKSDKAYFKIEERIKLYQAELQIRKYFEGYYVPLSTEITVIEIPIGKYVAILTEKINFSENISIYQDIVDSFKEKNFDEIILCAVKGTDFIIDIRTLLSEDSKFSFGRLNLLSGFQPDYQRISEVPHLFWNYILSESNAFNLLREITSAFLSFFSAEKIENSIKEGYCNIWQESPRLNVYLPKVESEIKYISFRIVVQVYVQDKNETTWYIFNIDKNSLQLRIAEKGFYFDLDKPYFSANIFEDYNTLLKTDLFNKPNIEWIRQQFVSAFSNPFPDLNYKIDPTKPMIHVLEFSFETIDCKPWNEDYKS